MKDPTPHGRAFAWLTPRRFAGILALLVLASFPEIAFGLKSFVHRDFGLFAYPIAHYHRDCFWRGELPLWNPLNNGGLPFLAQWNTLTLYPSSLFYLVFPLPWSLNVFCIGHLWWAGVGMFWLAERWTGNRAAAAVAGMAFAFNGLTLNALMWPNNIAALGWMPWVVLCAERGWQKGGRSLALGAVVGAMQMLTGAPEIIFFTWLLLGTFWAVGWLQRTQPRGQMLGRFCGLMVLVFALSAAQLLPFLDLLRHSHRDGQFATGAWAMPAWGIANFLVPQFHMNRSGSGLLFQPGQFWTSSYYPGAAVLALALWAAVRWRQPRAFLLTALLVLSLVLAMGDAGGLYHWIRQAVPAANFMRFPIKFVVLANFVLPLLAAIGVADLWERARESRGRDVPRLVLPLLALAAVIVVSAQFAPFYPFDAAQTLSSAIRSGAFLITVIALVCAPLSTARLGTRLSLILAVLALLWLDAVTHVPWQNPGVPPKILEASSKTGQSAPALGQGRRLLSLAAMNEFYRTNMLDPAANFSQRRSGLHNNVNLIDGIPKVDGFFSLYLPEERRVHFRLYRSEEQIREPLADFLGVAWVTARTNFLEWDNRPTAMPWVSGGQQPLFADAGAALTNIVALDFDPRRNVLLPLEARSLVTATNGTEVRIEKLSWTSQRIQAEVQADSPAWLVFSQVHYHAWHATVDGTEQPVWRANVAFQAVEVPAGRHQVLLVYRDDAFRFGCALSVAGLVLTGMVGRRGRGVTSG
ncbi:MAG: hypothetical protein QOF48_909 [Verrucomicrobiota bacterium]|jgi:hypothetical protein